MITIDGSVGGGQILRSSLALSGVTQQAFRITDIRGKRRKPGLMRQHLTAVRAAAQVCGATVKGDALKSRYLEFSPGPVKGGTYRFAIGTAGSANLVLQTILPMLIGADQPSTITLEGGTHNPLSPSFDFLSRCFLPLLSRMGPTVELRLDRHGFYPAGGGKMTLTVTPAPLQPLHLLERGRVDEIVAVAKVANLPKSIAQREIRTLRSRLRLTRDEIESVASDGPGNCVFVQAKCTHLTMVVTGFGQKGVSAERVAAELADEFEQWHGAAVPVDEHLADQLLLPMTLAGEGAFRTTRPSDHTTTNFGVLDAFTGVRHTMTDEGGAWRVDIG